MPILSELYVYPIKSCAGVKLERARLTQWGLEHDRNWMVSDVGGHFLTQREFSQLATVQVELGPDELRIAAPAMPVLRTPLAVSALQSTATVTVTIWDDVMTALDTGAEAAAWFSRFLGVAARLLRFDPAVQRSADSRWSGEISAPTQFADGFPFLLIGQSSLDDLNLRLRRKGAQPLPMNRFRPNLVISGLEAYEEDYVGTFVIATDEAEVVIRPVKPCPRCPIPTINQALGRPDPTQPNEPLDTLAEYRANSRLDGGLAFGQNAVLAGGIGAYLALGQTVTAELDFAD
jgi:uncharacterized protein YcbX